MALGDDIDVVDEPSPCTRRSRGLQQLNELRVHHRFTDGSSRTEPNGLQETRLVITDFRQETGFDFFETLAAVSIMDSIRCIIAVALNAGFFNSSSQSLWHDEALAGFSIVLQNKGAIG